MSEQKDLQAPEQLTEQQVWSTIAFASALSGMGAPNVFTPSLLQQNLINLNNNPLKVNQENLEKALENYKTSGDKLSGFSEMLEATNMTYKKTIEYYSNILSFDLSISCENASGKDYRSQDYKSDLDRVYKFLDNFDYKSEFLKVVKNLLRGGVYYTWFRQDGKNGYCLQMLPQSYCRTTGYWEDGLLFDFDMIYFVQPATSLEAFDPVFKEYYEDIFGKNPEGLEKYIPTNPLNSRNGVYTTIHQTSPNDGAWGFKMDMSNFVNIPFLTPMLKDALNDDVVRKLQMDKNMLSAYAILAGEMRMLDDPKSGKVANQFAIDPTTLGTLLSFVKAGLNENVKIASMPTEELEWFQFADNNKEMYANQLQISSANGASASRVIYSSDKMSQEEIRLAITNDSNMMKKLYSQFENFLNFYVNKKTRKFKFKFHFEGTNFEFEREARLDRIQSLADKGIVLNKSSWASAIGMKPQEFDRKLDEAHSGDFVDKLTQLISIHTSSSGEDKKGRPVKKRVSSKSREYDNTNG